jgi:hypothetical protein
VWIRKETKHENKTDTQRTRLYFESISSGGNRDSFKALLEVFPVRDHNSFIMDCTVCDEVKQNSKTAYDSVAARQPAGVTPETH